MKILAFLNAYTSGKSGGDMCFIEIFKRIKPKNIIVMTSSLGRRLCQSEDLKADFIVTTREKAFKNIYLTYFLRIIRAGIHALLIRNFDIIYATSDSLPDIIPAVFLKIRYPKKVFVSKIFHHIPSSRFLSFFFQQVSLFFIKLFADVVIVDSNILKKQLITNGFLRSKLHVIYPGITIRNRNKSEKKYDGVFMSRLHKSKGIDDILQIWEKVKNVLPEAKLAIIGHGSKNMYTKLKKQINKLKLKKNIDLLGFLPDEKAFSIINSTKVFLFPSHEEGFGMIVGEVLSCDVPIISYNLPVFGETFKPAIHTAPCFDINSFSKKTIEILNNVGKQKSSIENKELLKLFSWDISCKKELSVIKYNLNSDKTNL